MKKLLFALLIAVLFFSGCSAESSSADMNFETNVLSFEIEPNDGSPRYNAIVEIKNTGDVAIDLGYTSFSVMDADDNLIATEDSSAIYAAPHIVLPGETGYYFAARIDLPANTEISQNCKLVYDTQYIKPAETDSIKDYDVINVSFPENDYTDVIGEVVNGADTGNVDVLCICYDKEGNIVTMGGAIEELNTDHNTYFDILNMAAWGKDNIADYKLIARTNPY